MLGIPVGLAAANITEWVVHKYLLHGLGRVKNSFWAFHWHEHHGACRRNDHRDEAYEKPLTEWHAQSKEAALLVGSALMVAPLFPVAPFFTATVWYSAANYYRVHKKSHLDPEWAQEHLPWHWDHHMGPNQDANWCVTKPWFDYVMGTREPYLGTPAFDAAEAKKAARAARKANRTAA